MIHTNGPPFRVTLSGRVIHRLRTLRQLAVQRGMLQEYLVELRSIRDHLLVEPATWGDPLYHLHNLGLAMFRGPVGILRVVYAVDHTRRIVYLQSIDPVPGRGLA